MLAPDEFRDVPRNLDPLLSTTPAVGSNRSCLAPNVAPMRPPKRNTLTFTVTVRSIVKLKGSFKIDSSKQSSSDQLFEFQTEERIFPPWWRTNINKPPLCFHRRDLRCLKWSIPKHLQKQHHFLRTIQTLRLAFPCHKFSQQNLHDGGSDGRQKFPFTHSI